VPTRASREKRGTVAGAIIEAIVTIESHYRGIMCSAARNSERVDATPAWRQAADSKDEKSTASSVRDCLRLALPRFPSLRVTVSLPVRALPVHPGGKFRPRGSLVSLTREIKRA